jgi:tetratricopeptide (TPR) repeat protein
MTTPKPTNINEPNDFTSSSNDPSDAGKTSERPLAPSRSMPTLDVATELGDLEFDPDDVLASLVPYDEPPAHAELDVPPIQFADERPCHTYLEEHELVEQVRFVARRLGSELASTVDATRQLELALIQSELLSITGDNTTALSVASTAIPTAPSSRLARLQVRHLGVECGNLDQVSSLVESEIATLPDATQRAQLHLWHSEFMRLAVGDKQASALALSRAIAESPSDSQANLLRSLDGLAHRDVSYLDNLNSQPSLLGDAHVVRTLARIRGDLTEHDAHIDHPAAVILDVADALSKGDVATAALWLDGLSSLPNFERSIRWLRACLMAAMEETRRGAIGELLRLEQLEHDVEVRRALLERSVEVSDLELLRQLLQPADSNETSSTSAADQLVLSVLASVSTQGIRDLCAVVSGEEPLSSLAVAAVGLTESSPEEIQEAVPQTPFELMTARWLANSAPSTSIPFPAYVQSESNSDEFLALQFALELEEAREHRDWCGLARLFQNAHENSGPWLPGDRESLAALFFEAGRDTPSARSAWQLAGTARSSREAAVRSALEVAASDQKQAILENYADQLDFQDDRGPWLLLEAASRALGSSNDDSQRLLQHAHAISPDLMLAMTMGEDLARISGKTDAALDWLSKRAELADDSAESALLAAQEALLLMGKDAISAETCAIRAIECAPNETTLHVLRSHVAPSPSSVEWHDESALQSPDIVDADIEHLCQSAAHSAWTGDWRAANAAAIALAEIGAPTIATLWAEQAATSGQYSPKLFEKLFAQARTENDPVVQRELYERLARLDPKSDTEGTADLWQNAIIEREPFNLPALRKLERSVIRRGRFSELASISEKLMLQLDRNEAIGYAWLSSTLHTYTGNWSNGEHLIEWAARQEPVPLWSLRRQLAHALSKGDWAKAFALQVRLAESANYAGDATSLTLRSAESARKLDDWDSALAQLKAVIELTPDHVVALSLWATWQLQRGDISASADGLEQLAQACACPSHREAALSKSAELWLSVGDESRAEFALEQLLATNPQNSVASSQLAQMYKRSNSYDRQAALIEQVLEHTDNSTERLRLQVERARCLLALELTIAAEKALEPALLASPDDVDALEVKAEIAMAVDDRHEAEHTYTRLLQLVTEPSKQANYYRKLGELYERSAEKLDAAESAFERLLELLPSDTSALAALVRLSLLRSNASAAIRFQTRLVDIAEESVDQRLRLIELSRIYESSALDHRRAEEILEKARRKWQNDSVVLRAFAEFHQRMADGAALQVLLDRSATEARRALHTGRFEIAFFEVLATVASLRDQKESAQVADAVVSALRGIPTDLPGVGPAAGNARYDEILAPELLNLPLRAMLQRTGWVLDAALPVDLRPLQVTLLSASDVTLYDHIQNLAQQFDLAGLAIWVSPVVGQVCIPAQSRPPVLVVGEHLLESKQANTRDFLLIRAMKTLQTHTACLARAAPVDLWPLLAAYLSLFLPNWQPGGVDTKRLEEAKQYMQGVLADAHTHDLAALAQDVVLALGNRASQLGEAVNEWGSRTALLALGDPSSALDALGLAAGSAPLPKGNALERVKWVNRHPEARNVTIFSVSDGYLQLRSQLLRH